MFYVSCKPRGYFLKWCLELASLLLPKCIAVTLLWIFWIPDFFFAQCKEIQDSLALWIPHLRLRIPSTGFRPLLVDLGFWFQSLVGFRIPYALFRIPKPAIPDFTSKNFPDPRIPKFRLAHMGRYFKKCPSLALRPLLLYMCNVLLFLCCLVQNFI